MSPLAPRPRFFGPSDRPLFGWIHPPAPEAPARRAGVIVCNPFGYEAICAHRSLRHFAAAAAAAGLPALRFDYDGTGDSAGNDRDAGRVKAWVQSIHHAIDELRTDAGIAEVVLLGVRLGALLAALVAAERDDVAGLIAVAPILSGRTYVRELGVLQRSLGLPAPADAKLQEAGGFALTVETQASLSAIDLAGQDRRPPRAVLILDRPDVPSKPSWAERMVARGASVDVRRVPGYLEMTRESHRAAVPDELIRAATGWLADHVDGGAAARTGGSAGSTSAHLGGVVERVAWADDGLFGLLTAPMPGGATPTGTGVLMLNAGAIHHIGPNRLYTELARRWAAAGHVVLRIDLSGIGDSTARAGQSESVVYSASALKDVGAALRFLRQQETVRDCRAVGLCSGAYHAFKSAVAGQPVDAVIAINPLTFFWKEGDSLETAPHQVVATAARHASALTSLGSWRKLARGEVHVAAAMRNLVRYAAGRLLDGTRHISRRIGLPLRGDLGVELEAVARRGIAQRFVLASGDPGLTLLRHQGGAVVTELRKRGALAIDIIEGPNHTFTPLWSQAALCAVLTSALAIPVPRRKRG
jgi:alpha-beta hydrolase superfamily lysophospholipase